MRWIFIGIALGVGFMLAPYLVSGVWMVLQPLFLLIAVAIWKGGNVLWVGLVVIGVIFLANCFERHA